MSGHFAKIAYTPGVRAMQERYNGEEAHAGGNEVPQLGPWECQFIAARDSFYLATVGETGWPHVQHRGGTPGFLKVIDGSTLAFGDFNGNRQYVSVGNLTGNDRAALILMDYPNRRRLKILGHVEVMDLDSVDAEWLARVKPLDGYSERLMIIRVAAFDWNCSRHITPRFTESEWQTRCASTTIDPSLIKE